MLIASFLTVGYIWFKVDTIATSKDLLQPRKGDMFSDFSTQKQGQGEESHKAVFLQQLLMWK